MKTGVPVLLAALVVLSMGAMGTVGTVTLPTDSETVPTASTPKEITECTEITEPGEYIITQDLPEGDEPDCIHVKASDVVIDGQGHDIDVHHLRITIRVGADDRRLSNVTVRNVEVSGSREAPAIVYSSVDGGTVSNVTLSSTRVGVHLVNSSDVSVRESTLEGDFGGTTAPSINGVWVRNSSDTVITANTLSGYGSVLEVDDESTNTTIANNRIHRSDSLSSGGVEIDGAVGTTVVNNTIENQSTGIVVQGNASNTVVAWNDISHTADGIRVDRVGSSNTNDGNETTVVENNTITGNEVGVKACLPDVNGTEDVEVHHNAIVNNSQYGVLNEEVQNEESATLNATHNYWGASSGPSSANDSDTPFEDPVTGTLADGEGDAVSEDPNASGVSNVHFDPWLNQSITNASSDGAS